MGNTNAKNKAESYARNPAKLWPKTRAKLEAVRKANRWTMVTTLDAAADALVEQHRRSAKAS